VTVARVPGVLTVAEAAEKARVSTWTIRREIAEGNLRARRIGRCVRVLEDELSRWLRDYGEAES
jgi:excisionase family DNA binding protein